jgi:DivIVA domain-containing protein
MELLPSDVESKTFNVVRTGYDPDEVHAYLKKLGSRMSGLEERAKIAIVKADRLQRKLLDAQRETDPVATAYDDAFEIRRRLLADAEEEAERIRAGATGPADPFRQSEAGPGHAEQEAAEIVDAARAEAARLEEEAQRLVQHARSMAMRMDAESAKALADARAKAEHMIAEAAERARPPAEEYRPRADGSALIEPSPAIAIAADGDEVTIDLTDRRPDPKPSRYMSRSAGLPRLGESAGSVLGDMQKVRLKDNG